MGIAMIITLLLSSYLLFHIILGSLSNKWNSTKGNLISFDVDIRTRNSKFPSISGVGQYCILNIKYTYKVNDVKFFSKRIQYGKQKYYLTPEELEKDDFLKKIKNNDFIVFYFDKFPRISVLKPGIANLKEHIAVVLFIFSIQLALYVYYFLIIAIVK